MIFGIDLGTTNSLIGYGDKLFTDLVSSNVDMSTHEQVKRDEVSETVVSSYKTDMGMGVEGKLSIECSTVILKHLAKAATRRSGEECKEVVISVPAYFSSSQREAVYKAAAEAGLDLHCVINEPTAAALYTCKDLKDLIVIYDLGGGTFDISIVDSRAGVYSVIATDGTVLGGDDLDQALVNDAIASCKIPVRYRNTVNLKKMKSKMRLAKEQIQKVKDNVYVDLSEFNAKYEYVLTPERYKEIIFDVFGQTITMTQYLIATNIAMAENPKIVFVGGSSSCPYLREMVLGVTGLEEVKSDVNPDYTVAKGVAIYAKMLEDGEIDEFVEDVTKRLCIRESNGQSITVIEGNTIVPCSSSIIVSNAKKSRYLSLKLYQGDSLLADNNAYIGTLEYDYGREVEADEGTVEVFVEVARDGVIRLSAIEVLYYGEQPVSIELTAR